MTLPSYDAEHETRSTSWAGMSVFRERYGSVLVETPIRRRLRQRQLEMLAAWALVTTTDRDE